MAKKKKRGSHVWFQLYDDQVDLSDGVIILRPEIRIVGPFDLCFARLFRAYAWELLRAFCDRELMCYLPQSDPDPAAESDQEVSGNE